VNDLAHLLDTYRSRMTTAMLWKLYHFCGLAVRKARKEGLVYEADQMVLAHALASTAFAELLLGYAEKTGETDEQRDECLRSVLTVLLEHPQIRGSAVKAFGKLQVNRVREKAKEWGKEIGL
jgi:hypothetical protein